MKAIFLVLVVGWATASAAQEISAGEQRELESFLRETLIQALPKTPLHFERRGRETTRIPNFIKTIVNHTDWSVRVSGRFVDPANALFIQVADMALIGEDTLSLTLRARSPLAGEVWGEIKKFGKTRALFSAVAHLAFTAKVRFPEGGEPQPHLVFWEGTVSDVRIQPDLFGILGAKANEEVNRLLHREDTRNHFSHLAVNALRKFFAERRAGL